MSGREAWKFRRVEACQIPRRVFEPYISAHWWGLASLAEGTNHVLNVGLSISPSQKILDRENDVAGTGLDFHRPELWRRHWEQCSR